MFKRIIFFLLVLMASLSLSSCRLPGDNVKNADEDTGIIAKQNNDDIMDKGPVKGGALKLFSTNPDTLNPIITQNAYVQEFTDLIFESLVKLDRSQKPVPALSEDWEVSEDGLTWIFKIRNNVLWHDNIPMTAEDVEFTVETILNSNINSVYKRNVKNITSFAAVDKNTFRIVLQKPNSFTAEMMTFPVIPKHYYLNEDILKTKKNLSPVGTGPFRFQAYTPNSNIRLVSNEKWWGSENSDKNLPNMPYLAEIEVKIFDNGKDAINAFQTADIDVASLQQGEASKYRGRTDLVMKKYPGRNFEFVSFNFSKPAFGDKAVRQAIAYSIDKAKIINDVLPGEAVVYDIPVIPGTWLYDSNTMTYSYNPDKAREILLQNGWKLNRDTMYKYINGIYTTLNFEILVNDDNETRVKLAERIAEQLKEIGIKLQVKEMGWDEEFKSINDRRFDMAILGTRVSSTPEISFLYASPAFSGFAGDVPKNISGYNNPVIDDYLNRILIENDATRKKAMFLNMREIIREDCPYIGLFFYNDSVIYNKRIRGIVNPYIWNKYEDITRWYIPIK